MCVCVYIQKYYIGLCVVFAWTRKLKKKNAFTNYGRHAYSALFLPQTRIFDELQIISPRVCRPALSVNGLYAPPFTAITSRCFVPVKTPEYLPFAHQQPIWDRPVVLGDCLVSPRLPRPCIARWRF